VPARPTSSRPLAARHGHIVRARSRLSAGCARPRSAAALGPGTAWAKRAPYAAGLALLATLYALALLQSIGRLATLWKVS
jgi:hypothetical protein